VNNGHIPVRKEADNTMNSQYKKGVLELCVLALLEKSDCYGYDISERLSDRIDIADGTVYPILRKLKSDGLVDTYLQEESGGPPRKYYSLTKFGRETYEADRAEYLKFADAIKNLLEEDKHDAQ
jgi:PadR family transcriptional regulator PadR